MGQSFAPAPGNPGSTAIHKDSNVFIAWATGVEITRGPMNIQSPGNGNASHGLNSDALGVADGTTVVSLGDGGEAILTFDDPIANGGGPDFAVFENGFTDHYMEFAFVEVSSDGVNFFRFESTSEIPLTSQLTNFSTSDCGYVNNLAGKYRALFGTPFDLEELDGTNGLDINAITHVKLIDVVGSIDQNYATYDGNGTIINDPFPTEFASGGFDLDAVGVIHSSTTTEFHENMPEAHYLGPNPTRNWINIQAPGYRSSKVFDSFGRKVLESVDTKIDLSLLPNGLYIIELNFNNDVRRYKVIKE